MKLKQIDVKKVYRNAEIDKEIFVQRPLGFEVLKDSENLVRKFKKSLYGLKQSRRKLLFTSREVLTIIGFKGSKSDP